ncbi:MBL fold metallo-hydrolase [Candidatus Beckwithbacteria bacterium]|nr:MBL fold metallo-hydrolase [Candidatus Beckwithbacteria bacterium]
MKINVYLIGASFLAIFLLLQFILFWPDKKLHYIQCDVGQGDAILLSKQFDQILIDGGPDDSVLTCLQKHLPFWDKHIELVIATHPDKDHIGGIAYVFNNYQIENLVYNGAASKEKLWLELYQQAKKQNTQILAAADIKQVTINQINLQFVWPNERMIKSALLEDNDLSVVTKVNYDQFSALLTGDISSLVEKMLLAQNKNLKSLVLKISHHGSKTASTGEFLTEVEPVIATIGVGKNSFGHPASETLQKLKQLGIKVFRTDQVGDIEVMTDGTEFSIR